ncbi:5-oxoprolinase subunit PxpA [Verminephrobacter aporrectodeae]|uniref:5-oxoprolinase subunit PxpA n=1 Tax=Verminephrobacter aporrectodeae subsp. tuberculatae TaxID=1110392 RepID=A0ABT3KVE7_9BURK|nr:5-oxoprolinase subunit PxpA [Verminephrobacter aporrectodeae]MCW5222749.1 5-oxoprolinase subunit PxpA [Verminephrobacter aporrectodeae subsp. tuberculatae]MCW5257019.1 5-oxoprolinase subunit PxpA [Verminephrobacter aporrectodeae subsp. tuberculatae]MCW5288213.1 5-oxoprolinase subunit PxpA [Verminephrobacter aporrectodeae subsp. tuberculatae]MCW5321770.1 5-oxoprolinase subunit PxpA [Verminephrobacter aporrectodeae subsp. tuberculatae]MCW8163349.1 5-oxoprolinase subunit PxpA [Verminephrobacte
MKKTQIDLNSDMGEGFGPWTIGDGVDEQLMPLISSANIATGFHAGDPNIMRKTVGMARQHGVGIGAHPGLRDRQGFGRRHIDAPAHELLHDMLYQLGALREFARLEGLALQHIKPHGALYMHVARDEALALALVEALQRIDPGLYLYCMDGSTVHRVAQALGQPVVREFYADRDYDQSGSMVFTRRVAALDPERVARKVARACTEGLVHTVEGRDISVAFDSVCIHSDTPGALDLLRATRRALDEKQIRVVGANMLALA